MPENYNADWIVWLQAVIIFLLVITPGPQNDAVPIYVAQLYLLFAVNLRFSVQTIRTAAVVLMIAGVAGTVSAFASLQSMTSIADQFWATMHLAVLFAVAIVIFISSRHLTSHLPDTY